MSGIDAEEAAVFDRGGGGCEAEEVWRSTPSVGLVLTLSFSSLSTVAA